MRSSNTTVKRRRKALGLFGSGAMAKVLPPNQVEQLVLAQLDRDPNKKAGISTIQHKIAFENSVHIRRCVPICSNGLRRYSEVCFCSDTVSDIMHTHDPDGFELRDPTGKKIIRVAKHPIGIHERWSADGHDKLYGIGFPIWAIVDDATSKWLGAWIVPSNRQGVIVAYCFLCLVEEYGGARSLYTLACILLYAYIGLLRDTSSVYDGSWFGDNEGLWPSKCASVCLTRMFFCTQQKCTDASSSQRNLPSRV